MKDKQEMIWGNYTWLLFHTIAEKIKNEYFISKNYVAYFHVQTVLTMLLIY